jgi:hypothetical protein
MRNKCTIGIEELIIFVIMWNVCIYGCIVCTARFWMYNYIIFNSSKYSSDGQQNKAVIGTEYTSDGQICVSLVTCYQ